MLDEAGFVVWFPSELAARAAASSEDQLVSSESPPVYDFDGVDAWCRSTASVS